MREPSPEELTKYPDEGGVLGDFMYAIRYYGGHYCGYIAVPSGHPWYGQDYNDLNVRVHGGLTYGHASHYGHALELARLTARISDCQESGDEPMRVFYQRHLNAESEHAGEECENLPSHSLDLWWFGFDCAHYLDASSPEYNARMRTLIPGWPDETGIFRDRDYVYAEIESLAQQAALAWSEEHAR